MGGLYRGGPSKHHQDRLDEVYLKLLKKMFGRVPRPYDFTKEVRYLEALGRVFPNTSLQRSGLKPSILIRPYKVLHNRIRKNASSSSMVLWNQILTGRSESVRQSDYNMTLITDLSFPELPELHDYRRLVIPRDPYTRVLSAFLDKVKRDHVQELLGGIDPTPEGFSKFLGWVKDGGLNANPHWDLQIHETLFPVAFYTDVVRFEEYRHAFPEFLENVGVPRDLLAKEGSERGQSHATGADDKLSYFYDQRRLDLVADIYEIDFETFGYSRDRPF